MKPTYWTKERVLQEAAKYISPSALKEASPVAYRCLRKHGLVNLVYPTELRERRQPYSIEELKALAVASKGRADMQRTNPAAYNAMRRTGVLDEVFPPAKNKKKWDKESLTLEATKYDSRSHMYDGSPGAYSVAGKLGLLDSIGLPIPKQGVSLAELEMLEFTKTLCPDFRTKRFGNDYELDCYSDTLKLGIEYNGLYWHSEEGKPGLYHLEKTKHFEAIGIRVVHIWEHEWRDRKPQIKNYLMSACRANTIRLGARVCEFKEIDPSVAKVFLASQHIQGSPVSVLMAIGCHYEGTLIAVATFGKHHRQGHDNVMVLNRFACLSGYTVAGCLAKVSEMAYQKLGPLMSWADYSKSQGSGYVAAGWQIDRLLRPDYFYATPTGVYVAKQARRKSAIGTPEGMTEYGHAKQDGLYRIWDCGKIVLSYKKPA